MARPKLSLQRFRETRRRGKVLQKFGESLGLIYFGTVDQHDDDHDDIRGLTVSTSHRDRHFMTGTFEDYDISMVDRYHDHEATVVIRVKLQQTSSPHVVMVPLPEDQRWKTLLTYHRASQPIESLLPEPYADDFHRRFRMYAAPQDAISIPTIISARTAHESAVRVWPHCVELRRQNLYLYIEKHRLDETVLGAAVTSALWLAESLDQQ